MSRLTFIAALIFAFATPTSRAMAEEGKALPRAHVGLQGGVVLPQVGSELSTALGFTLEGGYQVFSNLAAFGAVGYSQPPVDGTASDDRLTAGDYTTSTTQRELTLTAGGLWRLFPAGTRLNAYGGLGLRVYLLETLTDGLAGGHPFLENRETSTRVGGVALLGGEYVLPVGAVVLQADFGGSSLPHLITGDVSTAAVGVQVGYRFLF